jgi:hypothetical protein
VAFPTAKQAFRPVFHSAGRLAVAVPGFHCRVAGITPGETIMGASIQDTGAFDATALNYSRCPDCSGTGELRIDSENINEHFEVEKQTVITPCPRCTGTGFLKAG